MMCPIGTFSGSTGGVNEDSCTACPAGSACREGITAVDPCEAGYYCPTRTFYPTEFPCPANTFTASTSLQAKSACSPCNTAGSYCPEGSAAEVQCELGYKCPGNQGGKIACPEGTYAIANQPNCSPCPQGKICPGGYHEINPISCPVGYYMATGGSKGPCDPCPEGRQCSSPGTITPALCADGYWAVQGSASCVNCPAGYYCASGVKTECPEGKYCPSPYIAPVDCEAGYYCPGKTAAHLTCPPGTYSADLAKACSTSNPGHFTTPGQSQATMTSNLCAAGFFCEAGSKGSIHKPCPPGYFVDQGINVEATCKKCTAGYFCMEGASTLTRTECPTGYYCPEGSAVPLKCPKGTYLDIPGQDAEDDCKACKAGKVCSQDGLTNPDLDCSEGYYCITGASHSMPTELPTGGLCTIGSYCPTAAATPTTCASGTFNVFKGCRSDQECLPCPFGFICDDNTGTNVLCPEGYYCPGGTSSTTKKQPDFGYHDIAGQGDQIECNLGYYAPAKGQSSCTKCPAGTYCPSKKMGVATPCPAGKYCNEESVTPKECPPTTFRATEGANDVTQCTICTAGNYCRDFGQSDVSGQCDPGYYCNEGAPHKNTPYLMDVPGARFGPCPVGKYCGLGTVIPTDCGTGKYSPSKFNDASDDCLSCIPGKYCPNTWQANPAGDCKEGYYCPYGSSSDTATECTKGHYCPAGSSQPLLCPGGYYQDLTAQKECKDCPAGKYCLVGSETDGTVCPQGYYCPQNTPDYHKYPCPPGTFGETDGLSAISECKDCTPGSYCVGYARIAPNGLCAAGFYCTNKARTDKPITTAEGGKCTAGQTCAAGSVSPLTCPATYVCNEEILPDTTLICSKGFKCGSGLTISAPEAVDATSTWCDPGKWCQNGIQTDCVAGTFLPSKGTGTVGASECLSCPLGKFCPNPGQSTVPDICPDGYICGAGQTSGTVTACSIGFRCPAGSFQNVYCPSGEFQNEGGKPTCKPCTAGNFCEYDFTTGTPSETTCPIAHKCPNTSMSKPQICLEGTFQDTTGQTGCKPCTDGKYCDRTAMEAESVCPAGYYCIAGSTTPRSSICEPGYYCPQGSSAKLPCPAGKYCADYGLDAPSGDCEPGYVCTGLAKVPNPTDITTGYICPAGYYCPDGITKTACDLGKFNQFTGSSSSADCIDCLVGQICNSVGLAYPITPCPAGKYCLADGTQQECPIGYMCPAGTTEPVLCLPGTYQDIEGQATCKDCEAGKYCSFSGATTAPYNCPVGHYCPAKTAISTAFPCPMGYINPDYGKSLDTDCVPCPLNSYCLATGLGAATGTCYPGYVCPAGTIIPNKITNLCPKNYYCTDGIATECPAKTYTYGTTVGAAVVDDCMACPYGKLCPNHDTGITDCPQGNTCQNGVQTICPAGSYCPTASFVPIKCSPGTYADTTGAATCKSCPAAQLCEGYATVTPAPCPANLVCLPGQARPLICDYGQYMFNNLCYNCPPGRWCWKSNVNNNMGPCNDGYICWAGSSSPTPFNTEIITSSSPNLNTYNGRAARGCYTSSTAPGGVATNTPCPLGTYMPSSGATECLPCPPGYYCDTQGLLEISQKTCQAGYYCSGGAKTAAPTDGTTGNACPVGRYCPEGTNRWLACADGTTTTSTAATQCQKCPVGYTCSYASPYTLCATGNKACVEGTGYEPLCSAGTYRSGGACVNCPAGLFCVDGRSVAAPGDCSHGQCCTAGFICTGGSPSPKPSGVGGGPCTAGYYCPEGATNTKTCPQDTFIFTGGARQVSDCTGCTEGFICTTGSPLPIPCSKGHYCPTGITGMLPCPNGTYSVTEKNAIVHMCLACPEGYKCISEDPLHGVTDYIGHECPMGEYCPERTREAIKCPPGTYGDERGGKNIEACKTCPPGYFCDDYGIFNITEKICSDGQYCPFGTSYPLVCPEGFYCNNETNYDKKKCPANHYCPPGTAYPKNCTTGESCPEGSGYPTKCVSGFVSQYIEGVLRCIACPPGTYSMSGLSTKCETCEPGYICMGQTTAQYPWSIIIHRGYKCPKGSYCPAGSSEPVKCPAGTYNALEGQITSEACILCKAGTYSGYAGSEACLPCGDSSSSEQGWTTCQCKGKNRAYFPSDSSCRCEPGYEYLEGGVVQSDVNSKLDCQPIVYRRCEGDSIRAHDGSCKGMDDCETACGGYPGKRSITLGICECSYVEQVEKVCNKECRASMPSVAFLNDGTIEVTYYEPQQNGSIDKRVKEKVIIKPQDIKGFASEHMKANEGKNSNVVSVKVDSSGSIKAPYGLTENLAKEIVNQVKTSRLLSEEHEKRLLESLSSTGINNPVICIKVGDTAMFEIDGDGHYPVYQKDSLLNSNPNFDYGAFKMLAEKVAAQIANGNSQKQYFGYTFMESGRYFFTDSKSSEKTMVIYVAKDSETCATEDAFLQPRTSAALSLFGLALNESIMLQPDYIMLCVILSTFLGTLGMLLFLMKWVAEHMWKAEKATHPKFRVRNKEFDLNDNKLFSGAMYAPSWSQRELNGNKNEEDLFIDDGLEGINTQKLEELDPFIIDKILKDYQSYKNYLKKELLKVCEDQAKRIEELTGSIEHVRFLLNERYEKLIALLKLDVDYTKLKGVKIKTAEEKDEGKKREKRIKPTDIKLLKTEEKKANDLLRQIVERKSEIALVDETSPSSRSSDSNTNATGSKKRMPEPIEEKIKREFDERLKLMGDLNDFEKAKIKDEMSTELINLEYLLAGERENQEIAIRRLLQMKRKKAADTGKKPIELIDLEHLSAEEQKIKENIEKEIEDESRRRANDIQEFALKKIEKSRQKLLNQLGAPAGLTEKEQNIMLENHNEKLTQMLEEIKNEKEKQLDELRARVEKRKQAKVAEKILALREEMMPELAIGENQEEIEPVEIPKEITDSEKIKVMRKEELTKLDDLERKHIEQNAKIQYRHQEEIKVKEEEISEDLEIEVENEIQQRKAKTEERYRQRQADIEEQRRKLRDQLLFQSGDKEASAKLAEEIKQKDDKIARLLEAERKEQEYLVEERVNKRKIAKQKKMLAFRSAQKDARTELKLKQLKEKQALSDEYQIARIKEIVRAVMREQKNNGDTNSDKAFKTFEQLWNELESNNLSLMFGRHLAEKESKLREVYHKKLEQRLMEKKGVKDKYRLLFEDLEALKETMEPEAYESRHKELRVEEENDLREMDIKETMSLRKEEFALRQDLEERAARELNDLQEKLTKDKLSVMKELFGQVTDQDAEISNKIKDLRDAIEREKDRRVKELELDKKIILEQCENDMKMRYNSFEDVIRKQRETEKLLKEKKGNIDRMLEERKKQISELKDKAVFTPEQEKKLLEKHNNELKTLQQAMESERNRQFAIMREKIDSRESKREREKSYNKKKIAFMMGTVGKNVTLSQADENNNERMQIIKPKTELERRLESWKKDLEEKEKTQKTTTFEILHRYLENLSKYKEKGLDGIYLHGEQYQKYIKLMKASKNLHRRLEELHKIKASGALMDLKAALKLFAENDYDKLKARPERIGGGFRCFDDSGNVLWELFKFVHTK